jgi:uncharacterized protein with NAD-binding domain and iron-sulfur cluster
MTKRRIAILGGGMGGLTTAYYLSRTPDLRDRFEITIYQMGWRLGGKLASGRDDQGRNLEHGLHVWFGCYENAFAMLKEIYAARPAGPGDPFPTWRDVMKPQDFTPIAMRTDPGWTFVPVEWPQNGGDPGDGGLFPTLWEMLTGVSNLIALILKRLGALGVLPPAAPLSAGGGSALVFALRSARGDSHPEVAHARALAASPAPSLADLGLAIGRWSKAFAGDHLRFGADHLSTFGATIGDLAAFSSARAADPTLGPTIKLMLEALNVFAAMMKGVIADILLKDAPLISLDDLELRDWLLNWGADPTIVKSSSAVRMLYDTAFLYQDGDPNRPSVGAGCALGAGLRLVATYKGSMMWEVQGGMGECVIAPLYEALLAAGVHFRFFHKAVAIEPTADGKAVATLRIDRQAELLSGDYQPTFETNHTRCWRATPDWAQLVDGERLKAANVNFESHWDQQPPVERLTLTRGADFDDVVLAIPLGGYKPLNGDPGLCDALIAKGGPFADFVNNVRIVPTYAVQLWINRDEASLGWAQPRPATVAGPQPLCVWADMSSVLAVETPTPDRQAKTLHYFCGTYPTRLYAAPSAAVDTPATAAADIRKQTVDWLRANVVWTWPKAGDGKTFDWSVLCAAPAVVGEARLDAQFLRANIDPTECTVGSDAGTTKYRLGPAEAGFDGFWLAGESTKHGFNATAVESAVMSGKATAKAIAGLTYDIVGYDLPYLKPSQFLKPGASP